MEPDLEEMTERERSLFDAFVEEGWEPEAAVAITVYIALYVDPPRATLN
jgi:hypothetical protein